MSKTKTEPHETCPDHLRDVYLRASLKAQEEMGVGRIEGTVIVAALRVTSPGYSEVMYTCPHGVTYWAAPDAEMQRSLEHLFGNH